MAEIPPAKPYVPDLEFKQKYEVDKQKQFDQDVSKVRSIIDERLLTFAELDGIVELTLGGLYNDTARSAPPIFIDARFGTAKVLDTAPTDSKADVSFSIRPELIVEVYEGVLHFRRASFNGLSTKPTSHSRADNIKWVRLLQLLAREVPYLLDPNKQWDPATLPKPTTDLEQVKRDVKEWGYGFVKDALSPTQLQIIKKAILEQAAGEEKAGLGDYEPPNQRVWHLINKGPEFIDLLNDPLITELVPWYIGDDAILSSFAANIVKKGGTPGLLHRDQVAHGPPVWHVPYGIQIAYYLIDNDESTGATRVIPKTHLGVHAPVDDYSAAGTIPSSAPAGTALIFETRLWHATGVSSRDDVVRPVLLLLFVRPYLRTHEAFDKLLRKDVEEKLSERQKALLGYRTFGALGTTRGPMKPNKTWVERLGEQVGTLRSRSEWFDYGNGDGEGSNGVNGHV